MGIVSRKGANTPFLSVLLIVYAFFSPIELFLGSRFESAFKILQYTLLVVLLFASPIKKGKLSITNERKSPVLPYIFLFILILLSVIWSRDSITGFSYIKSNGLRILLIILAYQICMEEEHIKNMLVAFMLGTVILSIMVTRSSVTSSMIIRTSLLYQGSAFDTNNLSGYLAIGFALMLNYKFKRRILNIIRYICCGVCIIAILMTASRGGVLAMIGAILFSGFLQGNFKSTVKYLMIILIGGTALVLIMRAAGVTYIKNVMDRFIYDSNGSGADRFTVWGYALQLAIKRPLLGYGIGSAFSVLQQYYSSNISTHNVYLTFLLDGGVVGLGLFISCLYRSLRNKRTLYSDMVKAMIVASMIVSLFLDTYNKKILWLPLFFFALTFSVQTEESLGEGK